MPPAAVTAALYAEPTVPAGRDAVVMAGCVDTIVMDRFAIAVCPVGVVESVTVSVTGLVPAAVGVPVIWPDAFIERPAGKPVAEKVYGGAPPAALTLALYAEPTVPAAREVVVIAGGPVVMVRVRFACAVCGFDVLESFTWKDTRRLETGAVGVPDISPVAAFSVSPFGSGEPGSTEKVSGAVPPLAVRVWEYGALTCPLASEVVVIFNTPVPTMIVKLAVAV